MRIDLGEGFGLNIEVSGQGEPLVLLHGFTGSARSWGAFGAELARSFTLVAVDLVGHGTSDAPAELEHYAMAECVGDTVEAVRRAGFERAHWLGYSMGGRTALHVAAALPGAVRSLITIGASPGLECVEDRLARRSADAALAARIEREGMPAFVDYWESIPLFATQRALPPAVRERIRAGRLANRAVGLANSLRGMGTGAQEPLHERLATLTLPALIMAGELDAKYVEVGQAMTAAMPCARFVAIEGAGHAAHTERPAACADEVRRFLAGVSREDRP